MRCKACDNSLDSNSNDPREELCSHCLDIALIYAGIKRQEDPNTLLILAGISSELEKWELIDVEDSNFYCEGD